MWLDVSGWCYLWQPWLDRRLIDSVCCFSHSWLLQDPEMQLRTTYKGFTEAVDAYFDHLMPIVVPLQASTIHYPSRPQVGTVCTDECELCVMAVGWSNNKSTSFALGTSMDCSCQCQLSRSSRLVMHRHWEDERVELSPSETGAPFLQASATVISVPLIRNHGEQLLPFVSNSTRKEAPSLQCKWRMNMVPTPKTQTTWPMLKW